MPSAIVLIVDTFIPSRCIEPMCGIFTAFFWSFYIWSKERANSGEMKSGMPLFINAAPWYTRNLPPPVGLTNKMFVLCLSLYGDEGIEKGIVGIMHWWFDDSNQSVKVVHQMTWLLIN